MDQEQGTIVDCVYCGLIKPELKGTKKCPRCGGVTRSFKLEGLPDEYSMPLRVGIGYEGSLTGESFVTIGEWI